MFVCVCCVSVPMFRFLSEKATQVSGEALEAFRAADLSGIRPRVSHKKSSLTSQGLDAFLKSPGSIFRV